MQIFREVADMEDQFLNLTEENLDQEHLCCIIRAVSSTTHGFTIVNLLNTAALKRLLKQ